jgi:hypothetical protein
MKMGRGYEWFLGQKKLPHQDFHFLAQQSHVLRIAGF